jgi:ABC-2 type transport system ATP-binding protein
MTDMLSPAISVQGLTKSYGKVAALRGVSFEVRRGETYALLGPNGAGKTTTIEILEGYRHADGGTASVLGMDPARGGRRYRERIGIVLQSTALEPELTVAETVRAFARLYPRAIDVDEAIDMVDLDHGRKKRVKALSGGQQRRLEIALGVIGDPDLLFLDEPTTGLDPDARRKIWALIRSLNERGKTILLSSHYMEEVEELAHRLAIIVAGQVKAEGSPLELQTLHGSDATIRFRLCEPDRGAELPAGLRHAVEHEDGWSRITVADTTAALRELTTWAGRKKLQLGHLTVSRPTLEDIYLQLTAQQDEAER